MPQDLALSLKPAEFDASTPLLRAEKVRQAKQDTAANALQLVNDRMKNEAGQLALDEQKDKTGALRRYRSAARAGRPNAAVELTGYPDLVKEVWEADEAITNQKDRRKLRRVARAFDQAAAYLKGFPGDTPLGMEARKEAEREVLTDLHNDGLIDDRQYAEWLRTGIDDQLIDQARATYATLNMKTNAQKHGLDVDEAMKIQETGLKLREQLMEEEGLAGDNLGFFDDPEGRQAAMERVNKKVEDFLDRQYAAYGEVRKTTRGTERNPYPLPSNLTTREQALEWLRKNVKKGEYFANPKDGKPIKYGGE